MPLVDKTIVKCSVELVSVFWYSLFIALFSFLSSNNHWVHVINSKLFVNFKYRK